MLGSDAVANIQRKLGYSTSRQDTILLELQRAQDRFEQGIPMPSGGFFLPWFLQSTTQDIATVAGNENVPLPDGFLEENEDDDLFWYNASTTDPSLTWTRLIKDDLDFLRSSRFSTGKPKKYALNGLNWVIFPTPDAIYTLKTTFYKADAAITLIAENKWLKYASDLLIGEAGMAMCVANRDKDALTYFQGLRGESVTKLNSQSEARRHDNRRYQMGGDD